MTRNFFEPAVNQIFRFRDLSPSPELRLIECAPLASYNVPGGREPFRLMFRGPGMPVLPQGICSLQNESLGELEIFLVPVGPDSNGINYEAIFN